jgi:putative chitinase
MTGALTAEQLATIYKCPLARATKWIAALNAAMAKHHIDTPLRKAHFLSQVGHESGRLQFVRELASGKAYNGRVDLGNTQHEALHIAKLHRSRPGEWWRGRGLIQITGYYNNKICGTALKLDLLNNPEQLEKVEHAAMSAGWFWHEFRNINPLADLDLITKVTKKVNGGRNGLEDRQFLLDNAKIVLGIGV